MKREKVYLVDKADNVIGFKWRDKLADDDCWRVIAAWVIDREGKILIQQRSLTKKVGPGIWSAACEGTIEYGDSPEETAVRELEEEIGVSITKDKLEPTTKVHYKDPQFGWRVKYGFIVRIDHAPIDTFKLQEEEVAQLKWITPIELDRFYAEHPEDFPLYPQYQALDFIN